MPSIKAFIGAEIDQGPIIGREFVNRGTATAAAWTPAQLGVDLALWLDANDADTITLNGSNVSQWDDKSGNDRHASQANAANQPVYTASGLNDKPVLTFAGSPATGLSTGTFANIDGFTVAAVARLSSAGSYSMIYTTASSSVGHAELRTISTSGKPSFVNSGNNAGAGVLAVPASPVVNTTSLVGATSILLANTTTGTYRLRQDGELKDTEVTTTVPTTSTARGIGSRAGLTFPAIGFIAEIIEVAAVLSEADQQRVEGYLAWKWGVTANLPADHPYKWDGSLFGFADQDAETYIAAVETADGQDLEPGVRAAIYEFVGGCKADGIWDAIKASCIMAGARTLDGALVPLKGTAPTNFNFVAGDYNRTTGLVGNGTTKYLDSNRNNNADPQNSKHVSVFIHTRGSTTAGARFIAAGNSAGLGDTLIANDTSGGFYTSVNSSSFDRPALTTGFVGASRASSALYSFRGSNTTTSFTRDSGTPRNENIGVFANSNGSDRLNCRLAFYSIGESLDLALLDARVTTLINAYGAI